MRIICDAPGQTCNRLWTYVSSVARCVVEHRKMMIIFYDWTIECFPHLLHCPFIYFPLFHPWYLNHGNGWNNYKGLTWKATHNPKVDRLFRFLGFTKGWQTRRETQYLEMAKPQLQQLFRPADHITSRTDALLSQILSDHTVLIGLHIRRGDYATWHDGRFFYSLEEYHQCMCRIKALFPDEKVAFFISSNEKFSTDRFEGCDCYRFEDEPHGDILDLHTLSCCHYIAGPFSTFSRWASFIGNVPLCFIERADQSFHLNDFSPIVDFFHFANGTEIADW